MGDFVFNMGKGKVAYYGGLPAANDTIVWVPLTSTGIEADSVLIDKDTLADVLAGSTNEHYVARQTAASVVVTVDDTNDRVNVDCADITWTAANGEPMVSLASFYDPDSTTGTDADLIPLTKHDFAVTPNGSDITAVINVSGFFRAS